MLFKRSAYRLKFSRLHRDEPLNLSAIEISECETPQRLASSRDDQLSRARATRNCAAVMGAFGPERLVRIRGCMCVPAGRFDRFLLLQRRKIAVLAAAPKADILRRAFAFKLAPTRPSSTLPPSPSRRPHHSICHSLNDVESNHRRKRASR